MAATSKVIPPSHCAALSIGTTYPNRAISSWTPTQIVINPNFGTGQLLWSVEVINSGIYSPASAIFAVTLPAQPQPSRQGGDYSFDRPSPAGLKNAGYVLRSLRQQAGSAKNITSSEAQSLQQAVWTSFSLFESTAQRMLGGYNAGGPTPIRLSRSQPGAGAPQNFFCYFAADWTQRSATKNGDQRISLWGCICAERLAELESTLAIGR